jgi:hypothetical protein
MFTHESVIEGIIKRPSIIKIEKKVIEKILLDSGIKTSIINIGEPHVWIMQSQRVYLEDGRCLLLKIGINPEWTDASAILNQVAVAEIIRSIGIKQPKVLAYSSNTNDYGFRFILSESQTGIRFCDRYESASKLEKEKLYGLLGQVYSRIHSITNEWSGVWDGTPLKKKYPIHPADFYSNAEFHNGSAKFLLENGVISKEIFEEVCTIWDENINFLKQRPSMLVHVSPFPWSIYISPKEDMWSEGGFSALGDFMWWDPMSDVAHLLYPPFLNITPEEQNAFIKEYSKPQDEYAINLYLLLFRLCAMSGCYLSPVQREYSKTWIKQEVNTLSVTINKIRSMKTS